MAKSFKISMISLFYGFLCFGCVTTNEYEISMKENLSVSCGSEVFDDTSLLLLVKCKWNNASVRAQKTEYLLTGSHEYELLTDDEFLKVVESYRAKGIQLPFLAGMTIAVGSGAVANGEKALGAFAVLGVSLIAKEVLKPDDDHVVPYGMSTQLQLSPSSTNERLVLINPIPQKVHPQKLKFCHPSKKNQCIEVPIQVGVGVFRSRLWNLNF